MSNEEQHSKTQFKMETKTLFQPPLEELAKVLEQALSSIFTHAEVKVVACPDLTTPPFNLAFSGLCGNTCLADIGSSSYLLPNAQKDKLYDLKQIANLIQMQPACIIGAGLGPWPYVGVNCEMIANMIIEKDTIVNNTKVSKVGSDGCILSTLPNHETRCAILANIFCCEGLPGKVLQVHCKIRTGEDDLISCMQKALKHHYNDQIIGLGGAFLLNGSSAKQHVMPEFSKTPLQTPKDVQAWIHYYNHTAPLTAVGVLVSDDPGMDLKTQHFHGFNDNGEGGHFYTDIEPVAAEYLGYFSLANKLHKIDRPL